VTSHSNGPEPTPEQTSAELLDGLKTCRSIVENYMSLLDPSHVAPPLGDSAANDDDSDEPEAAARD
jgi:hypothetical protein